MTVSLNIEPGLQQRLSARALTSGLPLDRFIEKVLEREAAPASLGAPDSLTGAEKARAFRAWANSFPADLPVLSLDDVNRESIYRRDR